MTIFNNKGNMKFFFAGFMIKGMTFNRNLTF